MAASPLSVELDTPEVELGDVVRGRVRVHEELLRAARLDVVLERGGKRVADVKLATVTVATGPLAAGASYPFELAVPLDAPFTFDGHAHSNGYRVTARADVAWAIDPKAVAGVGVWPRRVAPSAEAIEAAVAAVPRAVKRTPLGCQILLWLVLGPLVAMMAVALAPFVMWFLAKRYILRTRVGGFGVEVPARPAAFGEWVPVTVRFRLKRSLHVARLGLLFRGTEEWKTGTGKDSQTHYHHFHEEKLAALENVWLAPAPAGHAQQGGGGAYRDAPRVAGGEAALEWRTHVLMPPTGRPTIDRSVYYTVEAKLEVRGWPDGKEQ
ncbi:MAG: hypothetical protein IT373_36850, partial [Polyangiaceae bacterium]|nr:hypothetical protein [Polyangiaceae bacterium]